MAKFIVTELQRVRVAREFEAPNEEAAYDLFCEGEGVSCGRDGDVIDSELVSVVAALAGVDDLDARRAYHGGDKPIRR